MCVTRYCGWLPRYINPKVKEVNPYHTGNLRLFFCLSVSTNALRYTNRAALCYITAKCVAYSSFSHAGAFDAFRIESSA